MGLIVAGTFVVWLVVARDRLWSQEEVTAGGEADRVAKDTIGTRSSAGSLTNFPEKE